MAELKFEIVEHVGVLEEDACKASAFLLFPANDEKE